MYKKFIWKVIYYYIYLLCTHFRTCIFCILSVCMYLLSTIVISHFVCAPPFHNFFSQSVVVMIWKYPFFVPPLCRPPYDLSYELCDDTFWIWNVWLYLAGKNEREKSSRPPSFGSYKRFSIAVGRKDQRDPQNLAFDYCSKMGGLSQCVHSWFWGLSRPILLSSGNLPPNLFYSK